MKAITNIPELEALYGAPGRASLDKVQDRLTPNYSTWIKASRFAILTTVGPNGSDGSPRGDDGPVVRIADEKTLHLPDWRGNNRLDSLRNIVEDGRVSLMFMVPGSKNVVRVNGSAVLTDDAELTATFEKNGQRPRTVIIIEIAEIYFQCAKALMRSGLWSERDESADVPTAGDFIREFQADFDGKAYDEGYADYAEPKMW